MHNLLTPKEAGIEVLSNEQKKMLLTLLDRGPAIIAIADGLASGSRLASWIVRAALIIAGLLGGGAGGIVVWKSLRGIT